MRFFTAMLLVLAATRVGAINGQVIVPDGNVERLREAIELANSSDEPTRILLRTGGRYELQAELPDIAGTVELEGAGAVLTAEAEDGFRLFRILPGGSLRVSNLTVREMDFEDLSEEIFDNRGNLQLDRVAMIANQMRCLHNNCFVRLIYNTGDAELRNVTIVDNRTVSLVSGDWIIRNFGALRIVNSTIARNESAQAAIGSQAFATNLGGGGPGVPPTIVNSVVADNLPENCDRPAVSLGGNVETDGSCGFAARFDRQVIDAGIGGVTRGDGLTPAPSLEPGSPALGNGRRIYCEPVDGRGLPRFRGAGFGSCDSGSFERIRP